MIGQSPEAVEVGTVAAPPVERELVFDIAKRGLVVAPAITQRASLMGTWILRNRALAWGTTMTVKNSLAISDSELGPREDRCRQTGDASGPNPACKPPTQGENPATLTQR